jgi:hypothetical protein
VNIDSFCQYVKADPGLYNFFEPEDYVFMGQNGNVYLFTHKKDVTTNVNSTNDNIPPRATIKGVSLIDGFYECAKNDHTFFSGKRDKNDKGDQTNPKELFT